MVSCRKVRTAWVFGVAYMLRGLYTYGYMTKGKLTVQDQNDFCQ